MRWIWIGPVVVTCTTLAAACGSGDDFASGSDGGGTGGSAGVGGTDGGVVVEAGTLYGLAVINPRCGTGDGGQSDGCIDCTATSCVAQYVQCFGDAWRSSLAGGLCETFGGCVMACACGDNACFKGCLQPVADDPTSSCYGCLSGLFSCEKAACSEPCADYFDGDTGADGGSPQDGGKPDSGKP